MIESLFQNFSDATVYFIIGATGTVLFLLRLATMMIGMDADSDFDMDAGDHGGAFGLLSMLSIVTFMMGTGWMGLACRLEWGLGSAVSALIAVGFGMAVLVLTSLMMFQMRRLDSAGEYNVRETVGRTGRVYLKVPASGGGTGQIEISVNGRRMIVNALSRREEIASFQSVKVLEVTDDGTLVVEPV